MKKIIITTTLALGLVVSTFGQGFFNFDNSANTTGDYNAFGLVTDYGTALGSGGSPNFDVGYIWMLGTTYSGQNLDPWQFLAVGGTIGGQTLTGAFMPPAAQLAAPFLAGSGDVAHGAGFYGDGTISPASTGLPDGTLITLQVIAWYDPTGTTGFVQAAGNGYDAGGSQLVTIRLAAGLDVEFQDLSGVPGFDIVVPEPTTMALAGLGGLALLFIRRKQ